MPTTAPMTFPPPFPPPVLLEIDPMVTKQKRKTMARKARQAEARARAALERRAMAMVAYGAPRSAEQAARMSVERLRSIVKEGRPRVTAASGLQMSLAAALMVGMERGR